MSARAYELADGFDRATDRLVELVRTMSDEQWNAHAEGAGWTVAQEALHLGVWMELEGEWFARLAAGKYVLPLSKEAADQINANLIAENPTPTREQVLLEVAGNRTLVRHLLIRLSDADLDRAIPRRRAFLNADEGSITVADLARRMLQGHVERHLQNIEQTIAAVGSEPAAAV